MQSEQGGVSFGQRVTPKPHGRLGLVPEYKARGALYLAGTKPEILWPVFFSCFIFYLFKKKTHTKNVAWIYEKF